MNSGAEPDLPSTPRVSATVLTVPRPKYIDYACWAALAAAVCQLLSAVMTFGFTSSFTSLLVDANKKAKKPKSPYTATDIAHDLHAYRVSVLVQSAIITALLVVVAYQISKGRGWARWILLVLLVLGGGLSGVIGIFSGTFPMPLRVISFLGGLLIIAAAVLSLATTQAREYFIASRPVRDGVPVGGGLGALFGPKPPRNAAPTSTSSTQSGRSTSSSASRSKAKSRIVDTEGGGSSSGPRGKGRGR